MIALNLSWPAVSQIWSLAFLPELVVMVWILKSTPIVGTKVRLNFSSLKRDTRQDCGKDTSEL